MVPQPNVGMQRVVLMLKKLGVMVLRKWKILSQMMLKSFQGKNRIRALIQLLFDWKSMGSLFGTLMFIKTYIRRILPPQVYCALKIYLSNILPSLPREAFITVKEFHNSSHNDCFEAVKYYLSSKSVSSVQVLDLSRPKNSKSLTFTMDDDNQSFEETYHGFTVAWSICTANTTSKMSKPGQETRYFKLAFMEKYKQEVQSSYIPHVMEVADRVKSKNRNRYLYTNGSRDEVYGGREGLWTKVAFSHPSTFDTIAIDPILKEEIKEDLTKFANAKEFYNRVGKAWKRGYLLYGPPGTGKTSMIAAIANFLEFDIYDLELTAVTSNTQLRKLLISTSSKSIIVVEDIDCSVDLSDRKKKTSSDRHSKPETEELGKKPKVPSKESTLSLSGVLNFADGLWSSCGEERLMIFTTNHKEKLDQALLRSGRMDKHVHLSYCEIEAFKILMKNYLGIDQHVLVKEVEEVLPLVKMTPADIAEVFMSCQENADKGMKNVLEVMMKRLLEIKENEEKKSEN